MKLDNNSTAKENHIREIASLLAGKWISLVLYTLQHDTLRFSEIQKALPEATQKVLTGTLRKLERNGMVDRTLYPTVPPQVEYKLAPPGLELLNLSEIMAAWTEKHAEEIKCAQKAYDRQNNQ